MAAESIDLLIEFTKDEDPRTRATAIAGLAKVGDPHGFAPVVVALFDPVDEVRVVAATALGVLKDARAFEPLVECLDDPCAQVAVNCAWALGQVPAPGSLSQLLAVLADTRFSEDVRIAAATAVGERAEDAASDLAAEIMGSRAPGEEYATPLCDAARTVLLEALAAPGAIAELRASSLWALGHLPATPVAVDAAVAALADGHEWTVRYAIEALANFGAVRAVPALRPLLEHENATVAGLAATALERLR